MTTVDGRAPGRRSRPMPVLRTALVAAVLLVLPAVALWRSDAGWDAIGPAARMQLGFEVHTRRALAAGQLPLWNPYHLGGRPHLADPATLALYPPHVVLRFLPIDLFFGVSFLLHASVFGLGAYVVGRQLGASRLAALLAATGAMLATVVKPAADLPYSPVPYSVAWLPLIVGLTLRSIQRQGIRPSPMLVGAAVMALTGPPRGQAYTVAAIAACYLFAALSREPREGQAKRLLPQLACLACVAIGASAFQLVPHLRLWTTASRAGGLARDDVRARATFDARAGRDRLLVAAGSLQPASRVASQCGEAIDGGRFLWLGVPTIDGYGGAFLADYGRLAAIVSETRTAPSRAPATLGAPIRSDLLALMNVGSMVGCSAPHPDLWEVVAKSDGAVLARARNVLPRAFWTCAPGRATREEVEDRLRTFRYDETLTLREANPVIHVRWAAAVDASARRDLEVALRLSPRRLVEGSTWQYDLFDASRANLGAIVNHPAVEDTAGFERGALTLPPPPEPRVFSGRRSEWVLGTEPCEDVRPASIELMDRADGRFVAAVEAPRDGLVFLSETYYAGRAAWLDGARVQPLKVNLAFTGIPVSAGTHRIELRADASSLWFGTGVTALTLIGWTVHGWLTQRR